MIVIAGGAGFLGSHLVNKLSERNETIVIVDNLITGRAVNLENSIHREVNFEFSDVQMIDKALEKYKEPITEIYHLASIASPKTYQTFPLVTALSNSMGTLAVLNLAQIHNAKVLFASTSEAYGDALVSPQGESYYGNVNPYGPRSCYDESKRFGETLCYIFKNDVDVKIARIFNTYGPRMRHDDGRVITNFIEQALKGRDLTVNSGDQIRSFCYVDDTVRGLMTVMEKGDNNPYNVGNPDEMVTISELAEMIKALIGSKSKIVKRDLPQDDPKKRQPDITRIKGLGWQPKVNLKEGLLKTIEYLKDEI